jgi:hypothetical protein
MEEVIIVKPLEERVGRAGIDGDEGYQESFLNAMQSQEQISD